MLLFSFSIAFAQKRTVGNRAYQADGGNRSAFLFYLITRLRSGATLAARVWTRPFTSTLRDVQFQLKSLICMKSSP